MRQREAELNGHYDQLTYYSPLDKHTLAHICRFVGVDVASPVLDVGCGDGRLARRNPQLQIDGVDYNEHRARAAGAVHADLYDFLEATDRTWPLVVLIEVLEHLEQPHLAVSLARQAASNAVVATVPLDMPYVAHLSVWPDLASVVSDLKPDRVAPLGKHVILYWEPKT